MLDCTELRKKEPNLACHAPMYTVHALAILENYWDAIVQSGNNI